MTGESSSAMYPVLMNLRDRLCLIVGAGEVAARKVKGLLACGARVTVIGPVAGAAIARQAESGVLVWRQKTFSEDDVTGAGLVFAATDDGDENRRIAEVCRKNAVPVNVADDPDLCDFLVPSVMRRGSLTVAVATDGKSPGFARAVRTELERHVPDEYAELLELIAEMRARLKASVPDRRRRQVLLERIIGSGARDLLKQGRIQQARECIDQCISSLPD
jgi:precorrin-2 dehydrogenase / sirohydrochlorin ferrochelatase